MTNIQSRFVNPLLYLSTLTMTGCGQYANHMHETQRSTIHSHQTEQVETIHNKLLLPPHETLPLQMITEVLEKGLSSKENLPFKELSKVIRKVFRRYTQVIQAIAQVEQTIKVAQTARTNLTTISKAECKLYNNMKTTRDHATVAAKDEICLRRRVVEEGPTELGRTGTRSKLNEAERKTAAIRVALAKITIQGLDAKAKTHKAIQDIAKADMDRSKALVELFKVIAQIANTPKIETTVAAWTNLASIYTKLGSEITEDMPKIENEIEDAKQATEAWKQAVEGEHDIEKKKRALNLLQYTAPQRIDELLLEAFAQKLKAESIYEDKLIVAWKHEAQLQNTCKEADAKKSEVEEAAWRRTLEAFQELSKEQPQQEAQTTMTRRCAIM